MDKRFVTMLSVIVVVLGGLFWWTHRQNSSTTPPTKTGPSNHVMGENAKHVTLVEYGDFQCPACGKYYPLVKQVKQKYAKDIQFQFRNFPLISIHPNAMLAARAGEAAGQQGKFWEMHDMLYEQQTSWGPSNNAQQFFESYAKQLGLDVNKFKTTASSQATLYTINADIKAGQAADANATPTFVLNGKKIDEAPGDLAGFSKLIDSAIAEQAKQPTGH